MSKVKMKSFFAPLAVRISYGITSTTGSIVGEHLLAREWGWVLKDGQFKPVATEQ